jgi:hypothetical protein
MLIQFLLFVISVLLLSIFWELTKINSILKRAVPLLKEKAPVAAPTASSVASKAGD